MCTGFIKDRKIIINTHVLSLIEKWANVSGELSLKPTPIKPALILESKVKPYYVNRKPKNNS